MFEHIAPFAGDPILSLNEDFQRDPRPGKVNLSIGIYFDDRGQIPVLDSVREAERRIQAAGGAKPYLPMEGLAAMREGVQKLLFGADHDAVVRGRIATIQTVGSSSGLKVGADFIKANFPQTQVWVSDPTWDNHRSIFEGAGLTVQTYPYYDPATGGVRFDALCEALDALPPRSVVLMHACCHNPTGVDLSPAQWDALIPILERRELLPFLDLAYQGFGDGIDADAAPLRKLASAGLSFFVANSFSKSMSVYGERCGALSVVCATPAEAGNVLGQLKFTVRRNYSSPAQHAGELVAWVLNDPSLHAWWARDVDAMRERIKAMRQALYDVLSRTLPGRDFGYLLTQRGMFSYTGLTPEQVERLRAQHGVYLIRSGRMCVAGLNRHNVETAAHAMAAVLSAD